MERKIQLDKFLLMDEVHGAGLAIHEYEGEYYIAYGNFSNRTGEAYLRWVYPQDTKTKKPRPKAIPWAIKLGSKEQAIKALVMLLKLFGINLTEDK